MEYDDAPEWEKCKENVQPLKGGRDVKKLNKGLCAQEEADISITLKTEQSKFELELRSYTGDDPFSIWHDYVSWVEQNYPSHRTVLKQLLEKCLMHFDKETKYFNDERFVQNWIRYANIADETVEIYKHMYSKKFGYNCASFYISWSQYYETNDQPRKANQVLTFAEQNHAQPKQDIVAFRKTFDARMMKQVTTFDRLKAASGESSSQEPSRDALTVLSMSSKGKAPINRISGAQPNAKTSIAKSSGSSQASNTPASSAFKVFSEDSAATFSKPMGHYKTMPTDEADRENNMKPGKWTDSSSKRKPKTSSITSASPVGFKVHQDADLPAQTPSKAPPASLNSQALSVKKKTTTEESGNIIKMMMDTPRIKEVPMYDKIKVYSGMCEYSLEELRAISYSKKEKECQMQDITKEWGSLKQKIERLELSNTTLHERNQSLELELQSIQKQHGEQNQSLELKIQSIQKQHSEQNQSLELKLQSIQEQNEVDVKRLEGEIGTVKGLLNEFVSSRVVKDMESMYISNMEHTNRTLSSKRHLTPDTTSAKRQSTRPSPMNVTNMTQDCMNVMDKIFNGTLGDPNRSEQKSFNKSTSRRLYEQPASFQTLAEEREHQSAFTPLSDPNQTTDKPAAAASDNKIQPKRSAFKVFTDTKKDNSRLESLTDSAQRIPFSVLSADSSAADTTSSRVVPTREPVRFSEEEIESSAPERDEPNDCDLKTVDFTNFAQAARMRSTPFHPQGAGDDLADPGVSEIRPNKPKKDTRKSIIPPDFCTEHLSVIEEHSERSSGTSSSGSTTGMTTSNIEMTRRRSNSETNSHQTLAKSKIITDPVEEVSEPIFNNQAQTVPEKSEETSGEDMDEEKMDTADPFIPEAEPVDEQTGLLMKAGPVIDLTLYEPPELTEAVLNQTIILDTTDPFSEDLQKKLLRKVDISLFEGVRIVEQPIPKYKVGSLIKVQNCTIKLLSKLGTGGFATAYKGLVLEAPQTSKRVSISFNYSVGSQSLLLESAEVCIKIQKPACPWELYMVKEVRSRLQCCSDAMENNILSKIMDVTDCVFHTDGSLLINEIVPFGSLLNTVNKFRITQRKMPEVYVMYLAIELLHTVECLHRVKIIHGDIKPDNILFKEFPSLSEAGVLFSSPATVLIDFGRCIDMSKFKPGTTFTVSNQTAHFDCTEMRTGRPWTFQTDLFGLLGTIYCLIFGSYMPVSFIKHKWRISTKIPINFVYKDLWLDLFTDFLNIPSCDEIPNIEDYRLKFMEAFNKLQTAYNPDEINSFFGV